MAELQIIKSTSKLASILISNCKVYSNSRLNSCFTNMYHLQLNLDFMLNCSESGMAEDRKAQPKTSSIGSNRSYPNLPAMASDGIKASVTSEPRYGMHV